MGPYYKKVCLVVLFGNNEAIAHKVDLSKGEGTPSHKKHASSFIWMLQKLGSYIAQT